MTREIEARLKLSAMDRTAAAFKSVSGRMAAVDAKARAITAASGRMAAVQAAAVARVAGVLAPAVLGAAAAKSFVHFAEVDRRLTRIGITADATAEQMEGMRTSLSAIAQETATPIDQVTSGLEDLVSQGKSLPEALALLPSVARTAAASGAEVKDMAATTGALVDSLRIASDEMQGAFDVLVAGGKAGKFELKDMSQYLPSLAPMAAAVGLKGTEGLKRLTAMLQIVRNQTGDSASAATNLTNVFQKMESEETAKKFEKFGVDLRKEMERARKEGKELTEVFLDLSNKAIKGDLSKVPQLFSDMQVAGGMRALLSQRDALRKLQAALDDVDGSTMADFNKLVQDAKSSVDRLSNAWDRFVVNVGKSVDDMGASSFLDKLSRGMENRAKIVEAERKDPGKGGREERVRQMVARGVPEDEARKLVAADSTILFDVGGAYDAAKRAIAGSPSRNVADIERELAFAKKALDKANAPSGSGPWGYRTGLLDERGRRQAKERYDAAKAAYERLYPFEDYGASPGLPGDEADRLKYWGMPRPRPALAGEVGGPMPMPRPRPDPLDLKVQLDDAALDSEVLRLRARLQSSLDAKPLVLKVKTEQAPLPTGRSFQGGGFSGAP